MKHHATRICAAFLLLCTLFLTACGSIAEPLQELSQSETEQSTVIPNKDETVQLPLGTIEQNDYAPKGEYNKGVVLVKYDGAFDQNVISQLGVAAAEPIFPGSMWYTVTLAEGADTEETVAYLSELGCFDEVDYDYVMATEAEIESIDVSCNPDHGKQKHFDTHGIKNGWQHCLDKDMNPGGSPDVIVAVIDTGVDYNHLDLRNNIWVNSAEIPDNGKDDDGNGYVDDVYGWDCVGNDKDPIDDNGHGTHVAGIIAAENNELGGVGVAFNCKIMVIKAGNSSGYFNNSDIAEAIQYAYMNGASVINMSFGGSSISLAVEEALEAAYTSCILVAAAGNDSKCNNLACKVCDFVGVSYPAALPYVIGVMSVGADGKTLSSFSNYDHKPYNTVEYEVYAVGESVHSTWPDNKYAALNGTSMAAPTVSGIAALLRSAYTDREVYSTKFIQSQIVNTGTVNPYNPILKETDDAHSVANVYDALTKLPKPSVNLYDYSIDDSTSINSANNGNGVIDAGETVRLYFSLHNRGGVASNVNVSIDTERSEGLTDPYFTFNIDAVTLSDIGTYSERKSGDKYFEIVVSPDCPNDYLVNFNIRYTYTNGMDEEDTTVYEDDGRQKAQFNISSGYVLPAVITEDTVFTNDRLYIVGEDVTISAGATVTFEEGCEIQFYDGREYYNSPKITVYGTLNLEGTKESMISLHPSERYPDLVCQIYNNGTLNVNYVSSINLSLSNGSKKNTYVKHSRLYQQGDHTFDSSFKFENGKLTYAHPTLHVDSIQCSFVDLTTSMSEFKVAYTATGNYILVDPGENSNHVYVFASGGLFSDNILLSKKQAGYNSSDFITYRSQVENSAFLAYKDDSIAHLLPINNNSDTSFTSCYFSSAYRQYASQIFTKYLDSTGIPTVDVYGSLADSAALWPFVMSVEMFDKEGNPITTVGREEITVRVTFNRPMDTTQETYATFGTIEPYADYRIDGAYISDTVWEGKYTLKAQIENGQNYLQIHNACAAEDITKTVFGEYQLHEFTIDTTAAMAMNLIANPTDNGIELTFAQDDYDTLLGYNIYRADSKDGKYVKLNPAILLPTESTFLDDNAEPGKSYWYTYTVVLTDFSESNPAGKVMATAMDTLAPNMYHTPINQGYTNNNLVISCTASDNVAISTVMLYYRTVGESEWKTLAMSKQNDKYSATVFGSELTLDGLEYYIVAFDGMNTIAKGSAETPYTVIVKDASAISRIGDVDGDGTVTTKDALMLMQCINGDLILTDDEFKRADLNEDGVLSSVEALRILQYINGNVTTLKM